MHYSRLVRLLTLTLAAILLTALFTSVFSVDEDTPVDLTPAQFHGRLADLKAERLQRARDAAALSAADAASTQTNYDVEFYDVNIRIDDTTEVLYGKVGFYARAAKPGVTAVEIDLYSNMVIDSIVAPSGVLAFTRAGNVTTVTLDGTYNTDEQFSFVVYYNGHPVDGGFQAFAFATYNGHPTISTLSEPYFARTWWPCKDRMDDKADSFDITIEVDTSLYVASNGVLDSVGVGQAANSEIYYYRVRYPMVTYLFSLAIHPFTVWENEYVYNNGADTMPCVHAVYPDKYTTSLSAYGPTPQILEVLAAAYGEYPFVNEKYGHANFEWAGGMEHQTMTSMWDGWFGFYEPTIIHEAAHQWWGDMITCESWQDIWLNEGWATYSEALYYLATEGWASYHNYMNGMAYYGSGTVYVTDTTSVGNIFDVDLSYHKGAWVVHMLRGVLGDSLFFEGVQAYYNSEYKHGAANTEDFKNVFEAATGQELDWFFDQWVYGESYPQYKAQFTSRWAGGGNYDTYIWLGQSQTYQKFRGPVDVFIDYNNIPDDTVTLDVRDGDEVFRVTAPSTVNTIKIDPAGWILKSTGLQPWQYHIITRQDDLGEASQYLGYTDSIDAIGGTGNYSVSLTGGALPAGLSIDSDGIISGSPIEFGEFSFTVYFDDIGTNLFDEQTFTLTVTETVLIPGDVALDNQATDVGDLTFLIDYLFLGGEAPPAGVVADMNNDCTIDVADLNVLIQYLFLDGSTPVIGCAP